MTKLQNMYGPGLNTFINAAFHRLCWLLDEVTEGKSVEDVGLQLEEMGIRLAEVQPAEPAPRNRSVSHDDFIFFNEQLAALAKGGFALDRGLRQIAADMRSSRLKGTMASPQTRSRGPGKMP